MDEILYGGAQLVVRSQAPARPNKWQELKNRLQSGWRDLPATLFRWERISHKFRLHAGLFLVVALLIGAATIGTTVYTRGYAVTVNGQELGVIQDPAQFEEMIQRVEGRVGTILGREYTLSAQVSYEPRIVERSSISNLSGAESFLFGQVTEVVSSNVLTIGGEIIGVTDDGEGLRQLLDTLKAPYITPQTISAEFTVPVDVHYEYVSTSDVRRLDTFRPLLTSNSVEAATYTAVKGDTYIKIAKTHDMTLQELMDMNPQANISMLHIGDELTVRQSVPYLSVRTVDRLVYQDVIPAPVEYVDDSTMYQGTSKTLEAGADGSALVRATVTYVNGVEQSREVQSTQTLTEPETRVVARGTKPRPKTMASGSFAWPVRGTITSRYGYRSIFGRYNFHGGLDIACPYGTVVKAADGGRVIFSGWQGSYGNLIIIDHENGKTTYYAHNSSLTVGYGQRVYKGQAIARVGATGVATGPHCHFEVRVNGQRQNPRNYLP